jgi:hypothetical protein
MLNNHLETEGGTDRDEQIRAVLKRRPLFLDVASIRKMDPQ